MPSASSNVKVEKQQSSNANAAEIVDNNKLGFDGTSAIGQVYNSIAHKIRNLEKRKGKLESYRDTEKSGKELSNDQKVAVSKYNEVTQTLEFAREFQKQIHQIATVTEKELKKKQKKDEAAKRQNEANKIREVLVIQDILNLLTDTEVRQDFLNGANGACQLEKSDLDILDKLQSEVIPRHPNAPDEVPFRTAVQKSVDHFLNAIEGKPKEFGESKYSDIKNIFKNIQKCGYFDKAAQPPVTEPISAEPAVSDADVQPLEQDTATETEIVPQDRKDFHEAPAAANLPVPTFPPQPHLIPAQTPQIVQQVSLVQSMGPLVGMARAPPIPATGQIHQHLVDVQAVEQGYFKNQYIRPIADVIGPGQGNFYFLQDSELDSPDVVPGNYQQQPQPPNSQISPVPIPTQQPGVAPPSQQPILPAAQLSTQTFNNQSFQNIVPPQMYAAKPIVDHIPGFVPPVISLVVPNHQQKEQSSQMNTNPQSQIHAAAAASATVVTANSNPISFQPTNNQQSLPKAQRHRAKDTKPMKNDQRVPEITEWKPEDAAKPPEEMTEWRDQYATAVTDWNEETNEESAWSNNNRYQYRNNGGGNGSRDRNNRGSRPGNAASNGYRNRQSNSYQSNGGRPSGGDRGGNNGNFYRGDNFYSNGNYNKQDKQDGGGYRGDNKDGGFKGGNFRSRDSREQVNGSMRSGGGAPRPVRNGDSVERDRVSNRNTAQNSRPNAKAGNSYGGASRPSASSGNGTRPQSTVNA